MQCGAVGIGFITNLFSDVDSVVNALSLVYCIDEFLCTLVNICMSKIPGKYIVKRWTFVWIAILHVPMYVKSLKFPVNGCFRVLTTFGILHTGYFLAYVFSYRIYLFNKRQNFPRLILIHFSVKKILILLLKKSVSRTNLVYRYIYIFL